MGKRKEVRPLGGVALDYCYLNKEKAMRAQGERRRMKFLAVPKAVLGCGLSSDAVLLYSMMAERLNYSIENNWQDEQGRVFIIFTSKEIMETLGCQSQKAAELIKILASYGLIEPLNKERGRANRFLVKIVEDKLSTTPAARSDNQRQSALKIKDEVLRKSKPIDNTLTNNSSLTSNPNDLREVDVPYVDEKQSFLSKDLKNGTLIPTVFEDGRVGFRVEYPDVEEKQSESAEPKDEADQLIRDVLADFANRVGWMGADKLRVNQTEVGRDEIQNRLTTLTPPMIEYAAACIRNQRSDLMNPKSYALTALYNAPDTFPLYQSMKIKHRHDDGWYPELRAKTYGFSKRKKELAQAGVA